MQFLRSRLEPIRNVWQKIDTASLRVRLTVGVAIVSAIGLGSVAIWICLRMQYILVATHKQNLKYIADRFPHDVEIYSDMMSPKTGIKKAIDNLTTGNTVLWVKDTQGKIISQSQALKIANQSDFLVSLVKMPMAPVPELQQIDGRYWLTCGTSLIVKDTNLGKLYIAQDITGDQTMFLNLMGSLSIASLLSIAGMTGVIAWYVRRSLQPLQQMVQLTEKISADRLGEAKIQLENAPTEVKELSQTFDEMLVRLSEAWEHQRQLVSNVSHELRTPLTVVSGYLQSTLRRGSNLTSPQREALEIAVSEADRTIQLLQDLMDLARADSGRMYFHLEPILLNDLVAEMAEMGRQYSNRAIEVANYPTAIAIKADSNRLKQVLLNLIDNAVKYSEPDAPVTIELDSYDGKARIQVSDRGIGIPLQHQSRIFERFYRVDDTRSRATGGTGLGLSIVKTLVEGMKGHISVRSQPTKGTTFTVIFPASSGNT